MPNLGIILPIMGITAGDALFTTTQQRVLRLFFVDPGRSWIQQEVIDETGSGSGAVQRELARLVESGILTVTILGRQKHYQANRTSAIFGELRAIVEKTMVQRRTGVARERRPPVDRVEVSQQVREEPSPPTDSNWQLIFD